MYKIESIQNEKVKKWSKLKEKKYRDQENLFLIEGDHLLKEALKYGIVKEVLTLNEEEYNVPTFKVTPEILKKLTEQVTIPDVIGVCEKLKEKEIEGNVLLLDGIQDPGNLGTILRSAVAFHMPNVILSPTCVDLYNAKVLRSTEGMFFSLNIIRKDLIPVIKELKENHYEIIGTDMNHGTPLSKTKPKTLVAYIIGSEGKGIEEEVKKLCTSFQYIPMSEKCESLNAAVCASIFLYELNEVQK